MKPDIKNKYLQSVSMRIRRCIEFENGLMSIGQFGKYHNTLCLSPQILHKHCFCFLLGPLLVPRESGNNAYAKFAGTNKEYYGIFRSGLLNVMVSLKWFDSFSEKSIFPKFFRAIAGLDFLSYFC